MSLREAERRRRQHNQYAADQRLPDDDEVLTFAEWCRLNKVSPRTGRRILASPNSPIVTQLSDKRFGITRGNNRRWQAARAR
jgi:hypothetical protein